MSDALEPLRQPFLQRVDAPRWWCWLAFRARRVFLAVGLAAVPAVVLLAAALLAGGGVVESASAPATVSETFSRLAGAVATATAVAVSVASLTLGRELTGVEKLRDSYDANLAYHDRVRRAARDGEPPLTLGPFLGVALTAVEDAVSGVRDAAREDADALDATVRGVTLEACLQAVDESASRTRRELAAATGSPHHLLTALLGFDGLVADHRVRQFSHSDAVTGDVERAVEALRERIHDVIVGTDYTKTLELEWGVSRMSGHILVATVPAITTALVMMLAYGDGVPGALGAGGATVMVAAALAVTLLPITIFVSHLLRFVFVNQYTLPTAGFALGPEEPRSMRRARTGQGE